ncbi:hypothetical protein V6V47_24770, partial [Micromonospora sp. CPCC 205539]|uniref:hypothetical protein n=1 Tax=Micromonospora sp. CPCC 205539 TaxID=3122408 RepID=UPI002FF1F069
MDDTGYPCPACGAPADLSAGCAGCRRPPDPVAAEMVRLGREIVQLEPEVERARQTYAELAGRLTARTRRRAELAAIVRAGVVAPVAVPPAPVAPVPAGVGPAGGAETSTRTIQGLLFVLGGLLLGTAAVVFTAVAWAAVGVAGRALILAAFTALVLAAPLLAVRRGLRGTAETFAAVGLLLVVLDGYAAWSVDLAGVADWPGTRYAALVGGASAAVAVAYGRMSRLTGPWFAALLAAQPVLPLLAAEARPGAAGWTLVLLGVALLNLGVLVALRDGSRRAAAPGNGGPSAAAPGNGGRPARRVGRVLVGIGYVAALVGAVGSALVPLVHGRVAGSPLLAGVPLLLVALTGLGAAVLVGGRHLRAVAGGVLVPVLAIAVLRPVAELSPSLWLVAAATVALGLAGVVRLLPPGWRTGPRAGAVLVAAGTALAAVLVTVALAIATGTRSLPPWQGAGTGPDLDWGWQLAPALALTLGAAVLLLPRSAGTLLGTAGVVAVLLALPAGWAAGWPAVVAVDLVGGVALLLLVLARPTARPGTLLARAIGGAVLLGHGLLVALAAPVGALVALGTIAVVGLALAARRASGPYRQVAGVGLLVALLPLPGIAAVALFAAGAPPWWQARAALFVAALPLVALLVVRRHRPQLIGYAATGAAVGVTAAALAPLVAVGDEPIVLYAALATLGVAVAGRRPVLVVAGVVVAAVAVLAALPALVAALATPYGSPGPIWSGAPTVVADPAALATGLALAVLALAAVLARRGDHPSLLPALPFAAAALPVLLVAVGAPWPVLPVAVLLAGVAALLLATLAAHRPALAPVAAPVGAVLAVAGVVGLLATRGGTFAAEGVLLVAAVIVAVGARIVEVRVAGSLVAVGSAVALAVTAPLADGLTLRAAAYPVLVVAALALAVAAALTPPASGPAAEASAPAAEASAPAAEASAAGRGTVARVRI